MVKGNNMIRDYRSNDRKALYDLHNESLTLNQVDEMEFYFTHLLDGSSIIVNEIEGKVVSSIQANEHVMRLYDNRLAVKTLMGQICAVGHPEYLQEVVKEATNEAARQVLVTLAITDTPEIFRKYGFIGAYKQRVYQINKNNINNRSYEGVGKDFKVSELTKVYHQFTSHFTGYYERDNAYWLELFERLKFFHMHLVVYRGESGEVEGYIIYRTTQQKIYVSELVYLNGTAMIRLLCYAFKNKNNIEVTVSSAENLAKAIPKIKYQTETTVLARVNDVAMFNELYGCNISSTREAFSLNPTPLFIHEWE